MIDIIIPAYNATKTIEKTLMSIYLQEIDVPYKVTIVDDASTTSYDDILNRYNNLLTINYIKLEKNSGPGIARQNGIDNTNYPYIIFIDSDDLFYSVESLNKLYKNIDKGYDIVTGLEWTEEDNNVIQNNGNIHAKIYRRKFLEDNNIKFNDSRYHEDNYFNNYVLLSNAKNKIINDIFYIYSNNKDSLTKKIKFNEYELYLLNMNQLLNNEIKNIEQLIEYLYTKIIYLKRLKNSIKEDEQILLNKWIIKYIPKYKDLIEIDIDNLKEEIKRIINN